MSVTTAEPPEVDPDVELTAPTEPGRWGRLPVLATLAAVYIAVVAPTRVAAVNPLGSTAAFALIAAAGLAALLLTPRPSWFLRGCLAGAAGLGAVIAAGAGRTLMVWLAVALLLTVWTTAGRRLAPFIPTAAPGSAVPVVAASFVAVRTGTQIGANWQPLAALAAGGVVALLWSWILPVAVGDRLTGIGHAADRFLTAVIAVPAAAVAWVAVRLGSLVARRDTGAGWSPPPAAEVHSRSLRSADRPRRRLRPWTVPVVVVALVGMAGWFGIRALGGDDPAQNLAAGPAAGSATTSPEIPEDAGGIELRSAGAVGVLPPTGPIPEAYQGDDWFPSFRRDMAWVMDERVAWRPMNVQRVLDVETPTVNVRDRQRVSWTAPPCDCRRVTVWLYGGSGAFGVGQRDDHTVASELARAAAADGITLDVQNRGMPGQMHWRNSTRLAWDLTQEPPPDLVVFYEGAEEVASEFELRDRGLGNTVAPLESFVTDLYDEVAGVPSEPPPAPDGVSLNGWPTVDSEERAAGELAADRYDRSRAMSRWTAQAADLPVRYFWQPSRYDRGQPPADVAARAAAYTGAAAALPDDVRDLSGTLADTDRPVFYDDTNHNELGASLVAAAIWRDLRDEVTALAQEPS